MRAKNIRFPAYELTFIGSTWRHQWLGCSEGEMRGQDRSEDIDIGSRNLEHPWLLSFSLFSLCCSSVSLLPFGLLLFLFSPHRWIMDGLFAVTHTIIRESSPSEICNLNLPRAYVYNRTTKRSKIWSNTFSIGSSVHWNRFYKWRYRDFIDLILYAFPYIFALYFSFWEL